MPCLVAVYAAISLSVGMREEVLVTDSERPLARRVSLRVHWISRNPSVGSGQRKKGTSSGRRGGALLHA